jgi:N-acetylglutamate synthase-like GNAT family acetyltransferase
MSYENQVVTRFARQEDLPRVCELDSVPGEPVTRRLITEQRVVVIEQNRKIVGLIRLEYLWTVVPYIGLIWIEPDYRKRGLSKRLLDFVCDHLRRNGHESLFSSSQADEPEPQAWHRHVGFVDSGRIEGINRGGEDEIVFRLPLAGDAKNI